MQVSRAHRSTPFFGVGTGVFGVQVTGLTQVFLEFARVFSEALRVRVFPGLGWLWDFLGFARIFLEPAWVFFGVLAAPVDPYRASKAVLLLGRDSVDEENMRFIMLRIYPILHYAWEYAQRRTFPIHIFSFCKDY